MFRVTVSGPREQEASFFTVVVWRDQADHAAQSLSKGSRVVVIGRLQWRSMLAFRTVQQSNHCVVCQVMVDGCVPFQSSARERGRRSSICAQENHGSVP
jgi:single-stranded DNA-binding protein